MDRFWKAAVGVGGLGAVGAFIFWALYTDWLSLPIFSQLSQEQTFTVMLVFLALTCFALVSLLITHLLHKRLELASSKHATSVQLLDASIHRDNAKYSQRQSDGVTYVAPTTKGESRD